MEFRIFDFDDTLVTSGTAQKDYFISWGKERGYFKTKEDITEFINFKNLPKNTGITYMNTFFEFFKSKDKEFFDKLPNKPTEKTIEEDMNQFVCEKISSSEQVRPVDGVVDLLDDKSGKVKFSIATAGSGPIIEAKLSNKNLQPISNIFSFDKGNVFCVDSIPTRKAKPEPDVFLWAFAETVRKNPHAASLGVTAFMFDDSPSGVDATVKARKILLGDSVILAEKLRNIGIESGVIEFIKNAKKEGKLKVYSVACNGVIYNEEANEKIKNLKPDLIVKNMNKISEVLTNFKNQIQQVDKCFIRNL